jgi:ubiquinone/menaquinone biosynthesis C-methylase UbiE
MFGSTKGTGDRSMAESSGKSRSEAAIASYEKLGAHFDQNDPREMYSYMYSKFRSDYTLIESVGLEGKSVLNVGCSFPIDELYYARKVDTWVAIDLSPQSLDGAEAILKRELHPDLAKKFSFQVADACDLPFPDDMFDLSLNMSTIDHIPTPEGRQQALDEMARVTKPGGTVIFTGPNWWCLPYAAGIRRMLRKKTLHYGYTTMFSPPQIRKMGQRAGLRPVRFASSITPPDVWIDGYPVYLRWPAKVEFGLHRAWGYFGRRVGYAFVKP